MFAKPTSHKRIHQSLSFSLVLAVAVAVWLALPSTVREQFQPTAHAAPMTFTVNSIADPGVGTCDVAECTLREAIDAANDNSGDDTIAFNIPGPGVQTIAPASQLPEISDEVIIDGYTQPGASPNTLVNGDNAVLLIELNGANAGAAAVGLRLSDGDLGGNCIVRGLVINRFGRNGILIDDEGWLIEGNFVGTDPTGTVARGNGTSVPTLFDEDSLAGIRIRANESYIGGTTPDTRNLISSNKGAGIFGGESGGVVIQGNFIGTDASGSNPLGNMLQGVALAGSGNVIGGESGDTPGTGNIIAFNNQEGVLIFSPSTDSAFDPILSNSIFSNGKLGIDLKRYNRDPGGVTPNDLNDEDDGPNGFQNFPLMSAVTSSGGSTTVSGTLNSRPLRSFTVEFFANPTCDPTGYGEGQTFIGSTELTTDASGDGSFSATLPFGLPVNHVITTTATDDFSFHTSEFSTCLAVAPPQGILQFSSADYTINENGAFATVFVVRTGGSSGAVTVDYSTSDGTALSAADYVTSAGTLSFADGDTVKSFDIPILDDPLDENDETVQLSLSGPTGGALVSGQSTASLTILDDDAPPTLSIDDLSVTEGNTGTTNAVFTVSLSKPSIETTTIRFTTAPGTATSGGDFAPAVGTLTFNAGETLKTVAIRVMGDTLIESNETFLVNLELVSGAVTVAKHQGVGTIADDDAPNGVFRFSAASYNVSEGGGKITVTVDRVLHTAGDATVDYATTDGTASERSDYGTALGTLHFAAGETSKTFDVLIVDDAFVDSGETVNLTLSSPSVGAALGTPNAALLTINDNDASPSAVNPIDGTGFFVRQQYLDFLNREPDAAGFGFWTGEINSCGADAACIDREQASVSGAFFLSIEFQETGFYVIRAQRVAFGHRSDTASSRVNYRQFIGDARQLGDGVVVGQPGFDQKLEQNKQAYAEHVVSSAEFIARFPTSQTASEYADALYASGIVTPTTVERQEAISAFGAGDTIGRIAAYRKVADSNSVRQAELNPAFVLMEYFGYLRRNPTDAPDTNDSGYQFWLAKLISFNGDFRKAEMARSFILSSEYRQRFGQP